MIICAFKHLLDCEWFIPGNLSCQRYPFDAQSSPCFALVLHRYLLVMLPVLYQAATLISAWCYRSLPPRLQWELSSRAAFNMVFCSSSPASGLPVQVHKNLTVFTRAFLVERMPVSKVSLYHTAQLDLSGVNSTSLLIWLFWAETVLSIAKLRNWRRHGSGRGWCGGPVS